MSAPDEVAWANEQEQANADSRRQVLARLLVYALQHRMAAVEFLDLVDAVGLTEELGELELAGGAERHQRLEEIRGRQRSPDRLE